MAQPKTLSESQVALLRWIADGCPDGVVEGSDHRISAAALRRRGLVKISGQGVGWSAAVTKAGHDYLDQVEGPEPPKPRQANMSVTQRLVEDVIAAGGSLRVPRWPAYSPDRVDYRRRARLAERHKKVPAGKRLSIKSIDRELEISLVDAPTTRTPAQLSPVPVPEKVRRYHPAVRRFRENADGHEVSRALLGRAARILEAIAVEAERRGWDVGPTSGSVNDADSTSSTGCAGDLILSPSEQTFGLQLREEGVHLRGAWEEQVRRYRDVSPGSVFYRDRTLARGAFDAEASGQLELELLVSRPWIFKERQRRWADRKSWTLEERLPHLFLEIEERIVEAELVAEEERVAAAEAAKRARIEAEERERRWRALIDGAKEELVEKQRADRLRSQASAWREAQLLAGYCDAIETTHGDRAETKPWLTWARDFVSRLDPLAQPPAMPSPPEPTPEALQSFLPDGWSAHGPGKPSTGRWDGARGYGR